MNRKEFIQRSAARLSFRGKKTGLQAFLLGLVFLGVIAGARAEVAFSGPAVREDSGVSIQVVQLLDRTPDYGFVPIRISIRNDSGKTRRWDFNFTVSDSYNAGITLKQGHSVEVEDGKVREVDLLVPVPDVHETDRAGQLRITVTGYGLNSNQVYVPDRWANAPSAYIGLSPSLFTHHEGPLAEAIKKRGYNHLEKSTVPEDFIFRRRAHASGRGSDRELFASTLDFGKLPADWRSYSGLAGIFMTTEEWRDLPRAQEQALRDWMALGGQIVLTEVGLANTKTPLGFGGSAVLGIPDGTTPALGLADPVLRLDADPVLPWKSDFSKGWGLSERVGPLKVNTGLIIGFVIIFGIIIAPVNLFLFAPLRFRHRLFWTVPLISVTASLLLVGVIVLQEGFGGTGERLAVAVILPEDHKMAVVQEQVVRTALLLGQSFPLSDKFLFAELPVNESGLAEGSVTRQENEAAGDWFSSRTVKGYQMKAILPTRARLEVLSRNPDGAPVVLSSLPVNLRNLDLVDEDGKVWTADEVKIGEKKTLQARQQINPEGVRHLMESKASGNLQEMLKPLLNRPGYFYAEGGEGGGLPLDTLGSIRWKESKVIYLGTWSKEGS